MGSVQPLHPTTVNLNSFFDSIYALNEGYICLATKDPNSSFFKRTYFEWPVQRADFILNILKYATTQEVYFTPAMFSEPSATKEHFKVAQVIWTEFDGNAGSVSLGPVPEPSIKIQTSDISNQHWYWKLQVPITDIRLLEEINKRIAYYLHADLSVWDGIQVLRPPGTPNHKKNYTTSYLSEVDINFPVGVFDVVPK